MSLKLPQTKKAVMKGICRYIFTTWNEKFSITNFRFACLMPQKEEGYLKEAGYIKTENERNKTQ